MSDFVFLVWFYVVAVLGTVTGGLLGDYINGNRKSRKDRCNDEQS